MNQRFRVLPLVAALALALLSCGASAEHTGSERARTLAPSKPKPPAKCADPAKLGDAVLTVSDMPTGFGEVPPLDPQNAVRLGGGNVSSLSVPFPTAAPSAFRGFRQGTQTLVAGPYVADSAILLTNVKDAPKLVKAFREASAAAQTWDQPRSDPRPGTETYTSTALSFPKVGDETLAVRLAAKFRDAEFGTEVDGGPADYVLWRRGPIVSIVVAQNLDTLTYVKRADAKVAAILKPCPKKK
jgi:hypothetical protein